MFSFRNIYSSYLACRKNKRGTHNALIYEQNLIENLWNLEDKLKSQKYRIGKSICFLALSPKLREIFAASFEDRIVHHILTRELEPFYEPKFIFDVYNNRKNKGIHAGVKRAQSFMRKTENGYYLQLDIKGFFYNLDKNILFKQIYKDISSSDLKHKKEILWLSNKIIYHKPTRNYVFKGNKNELEKLPSHKTLFKLPPHLGLPIGNLTSQFFANIYMNGFDNFLKRELKAKYYLRYVDDFVLFDKSKEKLEKQKNQIEKYLLENLGLRLREDTKLKKHKDGLDFLGYIIRPNYTLVRKRVVNNYKYKKAKYLQKYEDLNAYMELSEIKQFLSVKASFASHSKHANSYKLLNSIGVIHDKDPFNLQLNINY